MFERGTLGSPRSDARLPQEPTSDREPGTMKDGEAMPPDALDPKGKDDRPADVEREQEPAEVEIRRNKQLHLIEGLTDNKAGG